MPTSIAYFLISSVLWILILIMPPGSKTIEASYRLNFAQGLVCSVLAILSIYDILPESITIMACTAYFFVDTVNKLLNDFVFRVPSYQKGVVRIVEYLHHFLSLTVAIYSELYYKDVCDCSQNPVLRIALAELSTPFLVAWRQTKSDVMGGLFVIVFIAVRIVYQGGVLIPFIINKCASPIIPVFSLVYVGLNVWFMVMILRKIFYGKKLASKGESVEGVKLD
eukprot:gene31723-38340_t